MPRTESTLAVDRAIELLASTRRRRLLRYLASNEDAPVNREELARLVHTDEDSQLNAVRTVLAHHHLPKLADAGMIEYDHRSGAVRPSDRLDELQPLLAACVDLEEAWE